MIGEISFISNSSRINQIVQTWDLQQPHNLDVLGGSLEYLKTSSLYCLHEGPCS